MSQKRQEAIFDRPGARQAAITTLTRDYPAGHVVAMHFHDLDQLVYAARGVMTIETSESAWVVPTHRAVWIPSPVPHRVTMSGAVAMRTLYLRRGMAKTLPDGCCVVNVSPLLRELILHACTFPPLTRTISVHRHLIASILDQLQTIQTIPLRLPNPADPRAVRIVKTLLANPADRRPLAALCRISGASKRTLERLFQEDVGMTFGQWRRQLRLMQATRLLAGGAKVSHAALEAGYSTPSAFISMFRRVLGTTPTRYFGESGNTP